MVACTHVFELLKRCHFHDNVSQSLFKSMFWSNLATNHLKKKYFKQGTEGEDVIQKMKKKKEVLQQNAERPCVVIQLKIPVTRFLQFSVSNMVNNSKIKAALHLDDITIFTYSVSRLLRIIAQDLPKAELSYVAYLFSICCSLLLAPPGSRELF